MCLIEDNCMYKQTNKFGNTSEDAAALREAGMVRTARDATIQEQHDDLPPPYTGVPLCIKVFVYRDTQMSPI